TALASAESLTAGIVVRTLGIVLVFIVATATVGSWLVNRGLGFGQDRFRGPDHMLSLAVVPAFALAAFTQSLHLERGLGASAFGILSGRPTRLRPDAVRRLGGIAVGVCAPLSFAVSGLKVDGSAIIEPRLLAVTGAVVAVATA